MTRLLRTALLGAAASLAAIGVAQAANWHMSFMKLTTTTAAVTWDVQLGVQYNVCWKKDGTFGDVCAGTHQFTITPTESSGGYSPATGQMSVSIGPLSECGVNYKVRVKRNALTYDTAVFPFPC